MLFLPDQFLGAHVQRITGRENMHVWAGECHVHAGINGAELTAQAQADPDADLFVHPECGCATSALYLAGAGAVPAERVKILSTGGMLDAARTNTAKRGARRHRGRHAAPAAPGQPRTIDFRAVNDRASCGYMKMITPEKLLRALREGRDEVHVDPELAARGRGRRPADDRDRAARRRGVSAGRAAIEPPTGDRTVGWEPTPTSSSSAPASPG